MFDQCYMCGYGEEALDSIPLCHWCYEAFADPASPFYAPNLIMAGGFEHAMSDPSAMMWVQRRMESVK